MVKIKSQLKNANKSSQLKDNKNSPKKNKKKYHLKRLNKKFIKKTKKNPHFLYFNKYSKFVFDFNNLDYYLSKISNYNIIKPTKDDYDFLCNKINELDLLKSQFKNCEYISLSQKTFDSLEKFLTYKYKPTELETFIKEQVFSASDRSKITCRNLANLYSNTTGKVIHKTQVNNIMRKKLGLHFLKTCVKTQKIESKKNIYISFCFIKTIIRALKLGYKILFEDESAILCSNNKFKCWRFKNESIFYGDTQKKKKNLLLLVDEDQIIYYKINNSSTNEETFLSFCKECLNSLKNKGYTQYLIILDNLSVHKTKNLINFYKENNINILFNSPYCSEFNCVELVFRAVKKKIYSKLFKNINEIEEEIKNIFEDKTFCNTLRANFKETLEKYKLFIDMNNNLNFKNMKIFED
jgi:transposase